jgi:hypothetical protein
MPSVTFFADKLFRLPNGLNEPDAPNFGASVRSSYCHPDRNSRGKGPVSPQDTSPLDFPGCRNSNRCTSPSFSRLTRHSHYSEVGMGFLDTVKGWLNIGGVSVRVEGVEPAIRTGQQEISGTAILTTKSDKQVLSVACQVVNEHTYKKDGESKTDTHILGEQQFRDGFEIKSGETREIPFTITFFVKEKLRNVGGALGGVAKLGAFAMGDSDSYSLVVNCDVKGTALDPSAKVELKLA